MFKWDEGEEKHTFTTREDAFPCSYTRRAEPTSGKVDMRETKAGGLGFAASRVTESSRAWEDDEGDDKEGDFGVEVEGHDGEEGERAPNVREPIRLLCQI